MINYNQDFLFKLIKNYYQEKFVKITLLDFNENPIKEIQGLVTSGSINVDSNSCLRRTCNLTFCLLDSDLTDFYLSVKTKFKLEIGLKNNINHNYPNIIWFPQGIYVTTDFSSSNSSNGLSITLTGKDKMCLLDGSMGGLLHSSVDFGVIENITDNNDLIIEQLLIKDIIKYALHTYGQESFQNIFIEGLDDTGLELLEYRGDSTLFLFKDINGLPSNITVNFNKTVSWNNEIFSLGDLLTNESFVFDNLNLLVNSTASQIVDNDFVYTIALINIGDTVGYRLTDLTYPGDLILNAGENVVTLLDKITNMLTNFEYYYDLEGHFIFKKKEVTLSDTLDDLETNANELNNYLLENLYYDLTDELLISSYSNKPDYNNIKNDFSIWGTKKTISGAEIPIHLRYAIDQKPTIYNSLKNPNDSYTTNKEDKNKIICDWREILYQMAIDYRFYNMRTFNYEDLNGKTYYNIDYPTLLSLKNPQFFNGKTGYEQYYTDIEGFWRLLYSLKIDDFTNENDEFEFDGSSDLYVTNYNFEKVTIDNKLDISSEEEIYYTLKTINENSFEMHPLIDVIDLSEALNETSLYVKKDEKYESITDIDIGLYKRSELFVIENNKYLPILNSSYIDSFKDNIFKRIKEKIDVTQISNDSLLRNLYYNKITNKYRNYFYTTKLDPINGEPLKNAEPIKQKMDYFQDYYYSSGELKYWAKNYEDTIFWIDFLESDYLKDFNAKNIGSKPKVINDSKITSIYNQETPNILCVFTEEEMQEIKSQYGYTPIIIPSILQGIFTLSSQGKSTFDKLNELLYQHTYCFNTVQISCVPIYSLQPNDIIKLFNKKTNINGKYRVSKFTIPLNYNGMMSITATTIPLQIL